MDHYEEIRLVKELGERIGYGNLMRVASALWAKELDDWSITSGAFVPAIMSFIKDEYIDMLQKESEIERSWVDNYYDRTRTT